MWMIRNVWLFVKFATQSEARWMMFWRASAILLVLRAAVLRSTAAFERNRLPVAVRRLSAAAGRMRSSAARSPRSTTISWPGSLHTARAEREPPSSSEISPKKSPRSASSRNTFSPVLILTDISTEPESTMPIQSPGSPYSNSVSPAVIASRSTRSARIARSLSSRSANIGTSPRMSAVVPTMPPAPPASLLLHDVAVDPVAIGERSGQRAGDLRLAIAERRLRAFEDLDDRSLDPPGLFLGPEQGVGQRLCDPLRVLRPESFDRGEPRVLVEVDDVWRDARNHVVVAHALVLGEPLEQIDPLVGHPDVARRRAGEDLVDDRELRVVIGDLLEHAKRERQLLGALHVADERGQHHRALLDEDVDDPVLLLLVLAAHHRGHADPLAQPEQCFVATVLAELLQRAPAIGLLGELVRRFFDRALESAVLGEQAENHFFFLFSYPVGRGATYRSVPGTARVAQN